MNTFIKKIYISIFALIFSAVIVQACSDSTSVQDSNVNIQNKKMNIIVKVNNNYKFYGFLDKNNRLYGVDTGDVVVIADTKDEVSYSFKLAILNIINQDARLRFKNEKNGLIVNKRIYEDIDREQSCKDIGKGTLNNITFSFGLDGNLSVVCEI